MNEKEFKNIKTHDWLCLNHEDQSNVINTGILADIARQLTRIADAMENIESNDDLRAAVEIHGTGGD